MKYVYLLQSTNRPDKRYVGLTSDLNKRLADHKAARCHIQRNFGHGGLLWLYVLPTIKKPMPLNDTSNPALVMHSPNAISGKGCLANLGSMPKAGIPPPPVQSP